MKQATKALSRFEYIILMSVLVAVDALAIDAILPALSFMSDYFGLKNENDRQLIVTSIFIGYAFGVMIFGVASDSFGRKRPIYVGFGIFLIGTLVTIFATDYSVLLLGRILQGVGAAGPQIIPTAITRDIYKGRGMAQIMSLIMMVFLLVPAIAPLVGQLVLTVWEWQGIFIVLGIYSLFALTWFATRLPETLPPQERVPFSFEQVLSSIREVFGNNRAIKYTIAEGLAFAAILAYISTAQQVFQEHFELGERFPYYFGALALVMMLSSFVNSRLVENLGMRRLVMTGAICLLTVSSIYLVIILLNDADVPLWSFMIYASIGYFCFGVLFGNMHSMAMEQVGHVAGVAASVIGCVSTLMATIIGGFIGSFYNDSITPIVLGFSLLMLPIIYITYNDEVMS